MNKTMILLALVIAGGVTYIFLDAEPERSNVQSESEVMETVVKKAPLVMQKQPITQPIMLQGAKRLNALAECISGHCDLAINEADPRAAQLEIGQQIKAELILLLDGDMAETEKVGLAQKFVQYPDGHVQEAAIDLMASVEPASGNVDAIIMGLDTTDYDAVLYQQAMLEFSRYANKADKAQIDAKMMGTLKNGDITVANTVAKNIKFLLNEDNYEHYLALANQLPGQTKKARLLKSSLISYRLNKEGG